jgi:hypothetical protein
MDATSSSFKIKTAITGHGQEGEFIPRTHTLNIAGGNPEFSWDVWKPCGENPVYPQGGTWIYDRAGWCPGMATEMKDFDITSYVTPGSIATVDYGLTTATGSSNYWVSNQLVSYGPANFTLDAAVVDIKNPSTKIEYARTNSICSNPIVVIRNTGSTALTSLKIEYWVNNNTVKEVYNWTGSLAFLESAEVKLPFSDNLWSAVNGALNNNFHVEISSPNGGTDAYVHNNKFNSIFNITNVIPSNFIIWIYGNAAAAETSYEITDQNGTQVYSKSGLSNNTLYKDTVQLPFGCYQFKMTDTDEDGISFWANNDGSGYVRLKKSNGATLLTFQPDFGKSFIYNFTVDYPLSYEEFTAPTDISLYPNPASTQFILEGKSIDKNTIRVYNQLGQEIQTTFKSENNKCIFNCSHLIAGLYYVVFNDASGKTYSKKMMIE